MDILRRLSFPRSRIPLMTNTENAVINMDRIDAKKTSREDIEM
jgi:hypothetical protein